MLVILLTLLFKLLPHRRTGPLRRSSIDSQPKAYRFQPKPSWVRQEVIRFKALMPDISQRKLADALNLQYRHTRNMTVGKTFVGNVIRDHRYEIEVLRKKLKHRIPKPGPLNRVWGLDLTFLSGNNGESYPVLGIVEHGSRACLKLQQLRTKASITILRKVLDAVEQYGRPKIIRTDNEACFTSHLFRMGLWVLGIRHQRINPCCPWQNGRIERFFGTLKEKTRQMIFSQASLDSELQTFRLWYNHIRTHQHLNGRTPSMVWKNRIPKYKKPKFFSAWEGVLTGYWFPH